MQNVARKSDVDLMDCWTERANDRMARDIAAGLTSEIKTIPSKYFYDARGSRLFERICELPEYYLTRAEMSILRTQASSVMSDFYFGDLVELGSGANAKIRTLLDALGPETRSVTRYVPVDVSKSAIMEAASELVEIYPELTVMGVLADFTRDLGRLPNDGPKLMLFLGSTIGNLNDEESDLFLKEVAKRLRPGDRFLLGMDLIKPKGILEAAYNDARGVTAQFNKNVLLVVNRELGANFRAERFDHLAFFNEEEERVEMWLRANRKTRVDIPRLGLTALFEEGETLRTEICRKFTRKSADRMIEAAGLKVARWRTDPKGWFALAEIIHA